MPEGPKKKGEKTMRVLAVGWIALVLGEKAVRKEIRELSASEFDAYVNAVMAWKNDVVEDNPMANLATFVAYHASATLNETYDQAHYGPHFLPLHSELMLMFERAIQHYDPTVAAHYFDWTHDPFGPFQTMFANGSQTQDNFYQVTRGTYANFTVPRVRDVVGYLEGDWWDPNPDAFLRQANYTLQWPYVGRKVGSLGSTGNMSEFMECQAAEDFHEFWCCVFYAPPFRDDCSSTDKMTESNLHGEVHGWISGAFTVGETLAALDGANLAISPTDPLFFLHHSQVERMYHMWYQNVGVNLMTDDDPCGGFDTDNVPVGHELHTPFHPHLTYLQTTTGSFDTPADVCRLLYTNAPYEYQQPAWFSNDKVAVL